MLVMKVSLVDKLPHMADQTIGIGEVSTLGEHSQGTVLGSCVSIILSFYGSACISHVFTTCDMSRGVYPFDSSDKVFDHFDEIIKTCGHLWPRFIIVGGSDRLSCVYDDVIEQAKRRRVSVNVVDVLGQYSRAILVDPKKDELFIRKNPSILI